MALRAMCKYYITYILPFWREPNYLMTLLVQVVSH